MTCLRAGLLAFALLGTPAAFATQAAHVHASGGWLRVLPGDLPAGGFLTLRNDADTPATLTGAASAMYGSAMLHQSSQATGMARMTMVDRLDVPAHGSVTFAPGSYHVMLEEPKSAVAVGSEVPITLTFADGSTLTVPLRARPANAMGPG